MKHLLCCSSDGTLPNQMATMEEMMKNPDTMRAMQSMMSSLKPEDLVAMQRQAGSLGSGLHSQQDQMMAMMQNPETMGMMQNIMAKMRPEDITVLQKQAAGLQGGFGSQGEQMQAMMNDPETLKAMQGMMKNIDSSDLAAMYKQAGMNITEEQVSCCMQNLSLYPTGSSIAYLHIFKGFLRCISLMSDCFNAQKHPHN